MNNNDFKVIVLSGLSGLILLFTVFMVILACFVVLPVLGVYETWNSFVVNTFYLPSIGFFQAGLFWFGILLILYAIIKNFVGLAFQHGTAEDLEKFKEELLKTEQEETTKDKDKK